MMDKKRLDISKGLPDDRFPEGKKYTAYQIWKAIQYEHPQKIFDKYGFEADSLFELVEKNQSSLTHKRIG